MLILYCVWFCVFARFASGICVMCIQSTGGTHKRTKNIRIYNLTSKRNFVYNIYIRCVFICVFHSVAFFCSFVALAIRCVVCWLFFAFVAIALPFAKCYGRYCCCSRCWCRCRWLGLCRCVYVRFFSLFIIFCFFLRVVFAVLLSIFMHSLYLYLYLYLCRAFYLTTIQYARIEAFIHRLYTIYIYSQNPM